MLARIKTVMQYLMDKGLSKAQAAGIVGNFIQESNLNPTAVGDQGASFGLGQWQGPRRRQLMNFRRGNTDLTTQLDFLLHELGTTEAKAGQALKATETPEAAAKIFSALYERPGVPMLNRRIKAAKQAFDLPIIPTTREEATMFPALLPLIMAGASAASSILGGLLSKGGASTGGASTGGASTGGIPNMLGGGMLKIPGLDLGDLPEQLDTAKNTPQGFLGQLQDALGESGELGHSPGTVGTLFGKPGQAVYDLIAKFLATKQAEKHTSWLRDKAENPSYPSWLNK